MDRLTRWTLQSPLHASVFGAVAYIIWQPVLLPLMHLGSGTPLGFTSIAMWTRFELTELALGSLVGSVLFYSHHWRPRSWHRDWAQWAVPSFALSAATLAHALPVTWAPRWIATVLLAGSLTGALFASITQGVRRLAGVPPASPDDVATDIPLD